MNDTFTLGIILARAGSKGLSQKNVLPVAGRPMIAWTIDTARSSHRLNALCLSTDLDAAAAIGRAKGLIVIDRPAELATDTATVDAAARHAVLEYERMFQAVTHVALLYANIPVRAPGIIDAAIDKLLETNADSVRSLSPVEKFHPDWMHRLDGDRMIQYRSNSIYRRQDLEPLYAHDGAIVAVTRESLFRVDEIDPHAFFGRDRRGVISGGPTIDVDSAADAHVAESYLNPKRVSAEPHASRILSAAGDGVEPKSIATLIGAKRPYVIAEIGVNHDGSVDKAKRLIDAAKRADANAIKLQIFSADVLASADAATCDYQRKQPGAALSQRDMLRRLELPDDALHELRDYARDVRIDFIATPFGLDELAWLADKLCPEAIKIASPDLINVPLLEAVSRCRCPLIVSTGASEWIEIEAAVESLDHARQDHRLALLHCVSSYPTPIDQVNLSIIHRMTGAFDVPVGFSDHTIETETGAFAVLAGADILEKHITLDRTAPGPDHAASLEPTAFADYIRRAREARVLLGRSDRTCLDIEREVRSNARGRIVARHRIPVGATITAEALSVQRPGDGIPPNDIGRVIGRIAAMPIERETPLAWNMMSTIS